MPCRSCGHLRCAPCLATARASLPGMGRYRPRAYRAGCAVGILQIENHPRLHQVIVVNTRGQVLQNSNTTARPHARTAPRRCGAFEDRTAWPGIKQQSIHPEALTVFSPGNDVVVNVTASGFRQALPKCLGDSLTVRFKAASAPATQHSSPPAAKKSSIWLSPTGFRFTSTGVSAANSLKRSSVMPAPAGQPQQSNG